MGAHACILVFDVTRKITYKNLDNWYTELVANRGQALPLLIAANKMDMDPEKGKRSFGFVERKREERGDEVPLYFVSASDGSNVVALFQDAIKRALEFREKGTGNFVDEVLEFIKEEEKRSDGLFN